MNGFRYLYQHEIGGSGSGDGEIFFRGEKRKRGEKASVVNVFI